MRSKIEIGSDSISTFDTYINNIGTIVSYNNKNHRVDGPAYEWNNSNETWHFEGDLHRKYGPAVRRWRDSDGWWFEDMKYTQEEFMEKFL